MCFNRVFPSPLFPSVSLEESQFESPPLTQEKVLELIEQAYPNPVSPEDLAKWVVDKSAKISNGKL